MERPKIKIEKTQLERVIEALVYAGIMAVWIYPAVIYKSLPETIPVHFNASGEADGFGSRTNIWWLPAVCTVLVAMLMLLTRVPHVLNYPTNITTQNAERQYRFAIGLLRILSLSMVIVFIILEIISMQSALASSKTSSPWLVPVILILFFSPLGYYIFKMMTNKK